MISEERIHKEKEDRGLYMLLKKCFFATYVGWIYRYIQVYVDIYMYWIDVWIYRYVCKYVCVCTSVHIYVHIISSSVLMQGTGHATRMLS